jgi:hypothetical protein
MAALGLIGSKVWWGEERSKAVGLKNVDVLENFCAEAMVDQQRLGEVLIIVRDTFEDEQFVL